MLSVSIIIPTYNYAKFILNAIESILAQDYQTSLIQIIVIDDGSTDNTKEILNKYIASNTIEYHYQENLGKASATILGIQKSSGEIIFNLDADDEFLPNKISASVSVYNQFPEVTLVSSPAKILFEDRTSSIEPIPLFLFESVNSGIVVLKYYLKNNTLFGGGSTFSARSSVLKNLSIPVDADMYIDELLVFATLMYGDVYFIKQSLSIWNIHGSNYSGLNEKPNHLVKKNQRLIKSSLAVLTYLKKQNVSNLIFNIYQLKHNIRVLSFKEQIDDKKFSDILRFLKFLIYYNSISLKIKYKYNSFQRLLPTKILRLTKTLFRKR